MEPRLCFWAQSALDLARLWHFPSVSMKPVPGLSLWAPCAVRLIRSLRLAKRSVSVEPVPLLWRLAVESCASFWAALGSVLSIGPWHHPPVWSGSHPSFWSLPLPARLRFPISFASELLAGLARWVRWWLDLCCPLSLTAEFEGQLPFWVLSGRRVWSVGPGSFPRLGIPFGELVLFLLWSRQCLVGIFWRFLPVGCWVWPVENCYHRRKDSSRPPMLPLPLPFPPLPFLLLPFPLPPPILLPLPLPLLQASSLRGEQAS